jgi:hypothetical protein
MLKVEKYTNGHLEDWSKVLSQSKNGTFLHARSFMEYHKDRFEDASLILYDDDKPAAIFPANKVDNKTIASHSGLTYGGLIVPLKTYSKATLQYLAVMLEYYHEKDVERVLFKQIPAFYCSTTQDEVDYALFLAEAKLYRVDIASVISQQAKNKIKVQERRLRSIKKASKLGVSIIETSDLDTFWNKILIPNLNERFGVSPVHSLDEIQKLFQNNKPHIRQFVALFEDQIMAGVTIFETQTTAHAQYISASKEGRANGSLDLLLYKLIHETYQNKDYFDFGIVNEQNGRKVNEGLLDWKEGFGARAYAHRFYEIETSNFKLIEQALK